MPERTPLNPRSVGAIERQGYRMEKLVYESVPQLHVAANLYIPHHGTRRRIRGCCFKWATPVMAKRTTPTSAAARGWPGSGTGACL
jgi:hypothetical protein